MKYCKNLGRRILMYPTCNYAILEGSPHAAQPPFRASGQFMIVVGAVEFLCKY